MKKFLFIITLAFIFTSLCIPVSAVSEIQPRYVLQQSELVAYDESMAIYNCYSYALGITNRSHDPGSISQQSYNEANTDVYVTADFVKDDLKALGYECIVQQSNRPSYSSVWDNIIALRIQTQGGDSNDYHFAKLMANGSWYHKIGSYAILKFNDLPSNNVAWTNEYYDGVYYHRGDVTYDSDIVYFLYKEDHSANMTYTSTGQHYHANGRHYFEHNYTCADCGTFTQWDSIECSGPPCSVIMNLTEEE